MPSAYDPIAYTNPELYIFPKIRQRFEESAQIDAEGFYIILDWKAPRARTRHRARLAQHGGTFPEAVNKIAKQLHAVHSDPKEQLRILMKDWGFRLPTASAILTVLRPDDFTVYDIRVRNVLDFRDLGNLQNFEEIWHGYQSFVDAVR